MNIAQAPPDPAATHQFRVSTRKYRERFPWQPPSCSFRLAHSTVGIRAAGCRKGSSGVEGGDLSLGGSCPPPCRRLPALLPGLLCVEPGKLQGGSASRIFLSQKGTAQDLFLGYINRGQEDGGKGRDAARFQKPCSASWAESIQPSIL